MLDEVNFDSIRSLPIAVALMIRKERDLKVKLGKNWTKLGKDFTVMAKTDGGASFAQKEIHCNYPLIAIEVSIRLSPSLTLIIRENV